MSQQPNSLGELEDPALLVESPNTAGDLPDPDQTPAPPDQADWTDPEVSK